MTLPDLPTLRRLHEAATKGPWDFRPDTGIVQPVFSKRGRELLKDKSIVIIEHEACLCEPPCVCVGRLGVSNEDAELIAASRNALPFLLHAADQWAQVQEKVAATIANLKKVPLTPYGEACLETWLEVQALIDAPPSKER